MEQNQHTRYNRFIFAELFDISKTHLLKDISCDEINKPDETFGESKFNQSSSSDKQRKTDC